MSDTTRLGIALAHMIIVFYGIQHYTGHYWIALAATSALCLIIMFLDKGENNE